MDEYIIYKPPENRPNFDTPAKDFDDRWESGLDDPDINALLIKYSSLGFIEHWETMLAYQDIIEETGHVGAAIWAEHFMDYETVIDIEKMFCDIEPTDYEDEKLEKMIASFRRIIAHLEGLRR